MATQNEIATLQRINADLLEALRIAADFMDPMAPPERRRRTREEILPEMRAAIAKAETSTLT